MEERVITCINCPMGCRMTVGVENGEVVSVSGNTCKRGDTYARQEVTAPVRMVTVKTREPIPKKDIPACMAALRALRLTAPVKAGETVLADVCGSGVDVIATKSV